MACMHAAWSLATNQPVFFMFVVVGANVNLTTPINNKISHIKKNTSLVS